MKTLYNESISKYTTVRIGGTAKELIIPETVDELLEIINIRKPKYFIGGGSNLLVPDHDFDLVVNLKSFDTSIEMLNDGKFKVGSSVRLQKLINTINENGYGGIEYLYSVPGLVGGAVVMNAGRGKKYNKTISDYIISVDVIENGTVKTIDKEECKFEHRNSIFKNSECVIISVLFKFPEITKEETSKLKKERIALCKEKQDASKPNFGSVFMECNPKIMKVARKLKIGGKVHFSGKTANWIINEGGNYKDAINSIKKVEFLHRILGKKCRREVITWE